MKTLLKKILGVLLGNSLFFHIFQPFMKRRLLIINYHRVIKQEKWNEGLKKGMVIDIKAFTAQMKLLRKHYSCVSEDDIINALEKGRPLPDHPVWVTFDDGYKDNFTNAFPILQKYHIPATLFVTTGFINKKIIPLRDFLIEAIQRGSGEIHYKQGTKSLPISLQTEKDHALNQIGNILASDYFKSQKERIEEWSESLDIKLQDITDLFLSWEEISEMTKSLISIGSHTVQHKRMIHIPSEEIKKQINDSKNEITKRINKKVFSFAYPQGKKDDIHFEACIPILKASGIKLAITTIGGSNPIKLNKSRFQLKRFGVSYDDNFSLFRLKLLSGSFWQKHTK